MVANRDSIAKLGLSLCGMIEQGQGASTKALELAGKLRIILARSGTYRKKYETNEERVLHRHLNLFRNKLEAAKTDQEKDRWRTKIREQRQKIAIYEQSQNGTPEPLDLDGL